VSLSPLLGLASTLIATAIVGRWRARRLRACWEKKEIREEEEEEEEEKVCDGLDFGLEALLFFGCTLDRAGVLCVRLRGTQHDGLARREVMSWAW
jgi:hypothetical protein